jgi:hypothetical protein
LLAPSTRLQVAISTRLQVAISTVQDFRSPPLQDFRSLPLQDFRLLSSGIVDLVSPPLVPPARKDKVGPIGLISRERRLNNYNKHTYAGTSGCFTHLRSLLVLLASTRHWPYLASVADGQSCRLFVRSTSTPRGCRQ